MIVVHEGGKEADRFLSRKMPERKEDREGRDLPADDVPGYDPETELLTQRGWAKMPDIKDKDIVATLNRATFELEWQEIDEYHRREHSGRMYEIENQQLDLKVTPGHNMWVRSRGADHLSGSVDMGDPEHREVFSLQQAKDIKGEARRYLKTANWKSDSQTQFVHVAPGTYGGTCPSNPGFKFRDYRWAEFIGWYVTEGSAYSPRKGTYRVEISQSKEASPENYKRIQALLTDMGFTFQELDRGFIIAHKGLYEKLEPLGRSDEKYVPRDVLDMGADNLKRCLSAMIAGDGCTYTNEETGHYGNRSFTTTSQRLAGNVHSANLNLDKRTDKYAEGVRCYYLSISETRVAPWTSWGKKAKKSQREEMTDYDGRVYCPIVPNKVVMVRRNGKTVWSGGGCANLC
jgi:UDP-glucuronate decarboxylase